MALVGIPNFKGYSAFVTDTEKHGIAECNADIAEELTMQNKSYMLIYGITYLQGKTMESTLIKLMTEAKENY